MAQTPYSVAEAFKRGEYARSGNFVSMGDAVYSYSLRLAHRDGEGIVWDVDPSAKAQSVTTARHINALKAVL